MLVALAPLYQLSGFLGSAYWIQGVLLRHGIGSWVGCWIYPGCPQAVWKTAGHRASMMLGHQIRWQNGKLGSERIRGPIYRRRP